MTLDALVTGVPGLRLRGAGDAVVRGLTLDSRTVEPGMLFAALPGRATDGLRFVDQAIARGAVAVLAPADAPVPETVPHAMADDARRALALLARKFHGAPDERLAVIGVTGTDGKTTTARMTAAALDAAGIPAAIGGTLGQSYGGAQREQSLTTPEAPALQEFLAESERQGARAAAIEVSSVALDADRVFGMRFRAAVLTMLGRDHLDVHGTIEAYHRAKRRLFEMLDDGAEAILPAELPAFDEFARAAAPARVTTFGETPRATWRLSNHRPTPRGASFRLEGPGFAGEVLTSRPGPWDARNIAAAVATAVALGADPERAVRGAAATRVVDGRFETIDEGQDFLALVDYAHTPLALERVCAFLRGLVAGRVIVVFGCGGDRDRGKREPMGRAAGANADVAIVTDDNPRGEDPDAIAETVLAGVRATNARALRVADRREAIVLAVSLAHADDAVLVAGKGHETTQEIAGAKLPFDDRTVLREALRARAGAA